MAVAARQVVASPVLVGRDDSLALLAGHLEEAVAGRGRLVLVAGEAGIGKTRLIGSLARRAAGDGVVVVHASAFPDDAPSPGAVLLDLASGLARAAPPDVAELGRALARRLREEAPDSGDRHRRRRLTVQDLTDALLAVPASRPVLLTLDDLHWADELSLDVLAHLAVGLGSRPLLIVCGLRSDELYPGTAVRQWRSRLVAQRLADELPLGRLDAEQTATVVSALLRRPAPRDVTAVIHARSDGIPLHVEELLGAAAADLTGTDAAAGLATMSVPDTLADAVLARTAGVDVGTRRVMEAAVVIGRSFDVGLLTAVTGDAHAVVDAAVRHLHDLSVVGPTADPRTLDFRHALLRDVLYGAVPPTRRRDLHERVARAAAALGSPDSVVSAHFERAGLPGETFTYARRAGREAATTSAHRDALTLYRRAWRHRPADLAVPEQARLLAALADEAAATDDNQAAAEAYSQAQVLWTSVGDLAAAADVVPRLVAASHLLGEPLPQRAARLNEALLDLEGVPGADGPRGRLLAALAAAHMLARHLDKAIGYAEQSRVLAAGCGDADTATDATTTLGTVLVFAGDPTGWDLLEEAVPRSVARRHEAEAARGYRMVGTSASVLVEYPRAERWLTQGIAYAEAVQLGNHRSYMLAHLAHVHWALGRWDQAQEEAARALADGRGGVTTRITAQYVRGYVALGRGDWRAADDLLSGALKDGESMDELQRVSPPLWGLAEAAALQGAAERSATLCERAFAESAAVADAAYLFPFLLTGVRAHLAFQDTDGAADWAARLVPVLTERGIAGTLPAVEHADGLLALARGDVASALGTLRSARDRWAALGRWWEGQWAALDLARCLLAQAGRTGAGEAAGIARAVGDRASAVGSAPLAEAAARVLAAAEGPVDRAPWHPLSAREHRVATLVAAGLTNRQIAAELVVAPKTVSAHVEHIPTKLGMSRRTQIAAWVSRLVA